MKKDISGATRRFIEKLLEEIFNCHIEVSPDKPMGTDYLEEVLVLLPKVITSNIKEEWGTADLGFPFNPVGIIEWTKEMINDPFLFVMVKANGATIRGFQTFCEQVKIVRNDYIQSLTENLFAWLPTEEGKSFLTAQLSRWSITAYRMEHADD